MRWRLDRPDPERRRCRAAAHHTPARSPRSLSISSSPSCGRPRGWAARRGRRPPGRSRRVRRRHILSSSTVCHRACRPSFQTGSRRPRCLPPPPRVGRAHPEPGHAGVAHRVDPTQAACVGPGGTNGSGGSEHCMRTPPPSTRSVAGGAVRLATGYTPPSEKAGVKATAPADAGGVVSWIVRRI